MTVYSQDITQVNVQIITAAGSFDIKGGEKDKITWKRSSPLWNYKVDVSGGLHRGKNPDKSGEFEIKLMKGNPDNEKLQALAYSVESLIPIDQLELFTVIVTDRMSGKIIMSAYGSSLSDQADGSVSSEPDELVWKGKAAELYPIERGFKVH